eukprot:TRINITY_DN3525_c1_g1_i1.p2 TRINITY_DN3525_c1_g1~~TRINITY_DN3525_c1_g1_i1.p2  ORF type:complete len:131 (+),score=31.71 TRINITY_DN3525_c1_g1_i1:45-437(+)
MGLFNTFLSLSLLVATIAIVSVSASTAGSRRLLEDDASTYEDAKEGFTSFVDSFWGGSCSSQEQCADYIATCGQQGECRPSWWVWMILVCIVLSFVASCICCICCGICSCILDLLCCCCRDKGYSPANTG